MATTAKTTITYADLEAFPDELVQSRRSLASACW